MAARFFDNIAALAEQIGQPLGHSAWMTIDQARITAFANATDDRQWIHVDEARARAESPFGAPVAHGFLTLSLLPRLTGEVFHVAGITTRINYGLDRLRFIAPVVVDSRVSAAVTLSAIDDRGDGRYLVRTAVTVEIEGGDKPALLADSLTLYIE
ncbi:MaoC family dehydratase [Salinisphaera japonica]|uniref:MaoC family dehydratase n=1 Tax=Salinisphaera japonica YTM-1 TaxID=1209778 RepID=A0A423Q0B2_9GAMM|nr:MaoC family dehydratase [Salinisphaera japonica]ROO31430.1 MaoC family dehydratase [Salinisphaera japonica YTM-1]